ncbi:MAG: FHA domain-containing protein [Leptospiraceae bacterium]|nr:FHA domain-containing protein [Leptospiraceae bacterium]MCP5496833.1 FHA domain-containing protein [Leptospiraceae bacterium]
MADTNKLTRFQTMFFCPKCKTVNPAESRFCMECGESLNKEAKSDKEGLKLLIHSKGEKKPQEVVILSDIKLGNEKGNADVQIKDENVALHHCDFIFENGKLYVKPLENANGVYIKIPDKEKYELKLGDELYIGNNRIQIGHNA